MKDSFHRAHNFGGSAGGGGYSYQSQAIAYVASHILAGSPLEWIDGRNPDTPIAIAVETGGPGDDFGVFLVGAHIEVQAKHGLRKNNAFWDAILRLVDGAAADEELYAVLLVDTTTSSTIRIHLRNDLVRLTQGRSDDLKPITLEFLKKLFDRGLKTEGIISRLRILVCDFEEGSQGRTLGRQFLSKLVEDPNTAPAVWNLLVKDGLDLIKLRGQRDAAALARLLAREGIPLSTASHSPHVFAERYRSWLSKSTAAFTLVGLGVALPIDQAWMKLRTLEKSTQKTYTVPTAPAQAVAQYHEWSRLANTSSSDGASEAEYIAEFNPRVIIIGGPGSGKSTLLKRLAYRHSTEHKTTLKVRLPLVWRRMEKMGELFEDALINVAGDGSGIPLRELHTILASPDYLLADGLDECDPHRATVADSLVKWASGHRETHVVITTRPIGHDPGAFPEWEYFEILPFNDYEVATHARQVISACCKDDSDRTEMEMQLLETRIKNSKAAKLASRNPLLLGFLIQLSMSRSEFSEKRAALYNQILALMQQSPVQDRDVGVQIGNAVASRFLDVFGWILQETPGITSISLLERAQKLATGKDFADQSKIGHEAEQALRFWEERRLIERLPIGGFDAVTFVHLSFCEYVAGRYLAKKPDSWAKKWLVRSRQKPGSREIILLAAGSGDVSRIVKWLLELDKTDDPASTEAILAAEAYCENEGEDVELAEAIAARLRPRFTSAIPFIAYEAGNAALPLVAIAPAFFGPVASKLLTHEQKWTRLVAWAIELQAGTQYVDIELLDQVYEDMFQIVVPRSVRGFGFVIPSHDEFNIQETFCLRATEAILEHPRTTAGMGQRIARLVRENRISIGLLRGLLPIMEGRGLYELGKELFDRVNGKRFWSGFDHNREEWIAQDKALLEAIIQAFDDGTQSNTPFTSASSKGRILLSLSALYETMGFGHVAVGSYSLGHRQDVEALVMTMRGAAAAVKLSPADLSGQAHVALDMMCGDDPPMLYDMLGDVHVTPDWVEAKRIGLDGRILAQALGHPSEAVAVTAAYLLAYGAGGPTAADFVLQVLNTGRGNALRMVAAIADDLWNEKALDTILGRLERELCRGCEHLFNILPHLAACAPKQDITRIHASLLRGIMTPNPKIATKAAEVCVTLFLPLLSIREIREAYEYWKVQEPPYVNEHGIVSQSPRPQLLSILIRLQAFTIDELLSVLLDTRSDVRSVAMDALVELLSEDRPSLKHVLKIIDSGSAPLEVLWKLLNHQKQPLRQTRDELLGLLVSSNPSLRSAAVGALPQICADEAETTTRACGMLSDEDPAVRERAARVLRSLTHDAGK